jgi:hypothetical protein
MFDAYPLNWVCSDYLLKVDEKKPARGRFGFVKDGSGQGGEASIRHTIAGGLYLFQ